MTDVLDVVAPESPTVRSLDVAAEIQVRDIAKRELDIRLVPWDVEIDTLMGREVFTRGAFDGENPQDIFLMGVGHEARLAIGQDGRPTMARIPVGRGTAITQAPDGGYATFRVARTAGGDETLALAADGIVTGASVEFAEIPGGTVTETRNGRRVRVHRRVNLRGASLTNTPAYASAGVIAVRSAPEGDAPVAEAAPVEATPTDSPVIAQLGEVLTGFQTRSQKTDDTLQRLMERLEQMEERSRSAIVVPTPSEPRKATLADWASITLRQRLGLHISQQELQTRALDDIKVTDNPGLVPDAVLPQLIDRIVPRRPFLQSTTRIQAPDTGMTITVPVITQHSSVAVQATEKTEIDSTALKVTTDDFPGLTIAGGADVSIQMIRRADPSFMDLLMQDLAAAYAALSDTRALAALFAKGTTAGTANFDPENLTIGEAWKNSITNFGEAPDTIWLSANGVAAFIDAKSDGSNQPLYFTLQGNFGAGTGASGSVSALRPVYVPALNSTGVDVMIGPSRGFVWAEEGDIRLEVDNPTLAGRDIALVGILFPIPRYASAFTTYDLGS